MTEVQEDSPPQLIQYTSSNYKSTESSKAADGDAFVFPEDAYDVTEGDGTEGEDMEADHDTSMTGDDTSMTGSEVDTVLTEDDDDLEIEDDLPDEDEDQDEQDDQDGEDVEQIETDTEASQSGASEILDVTALLSSGKLNIGVIESDILPSVFEVDVGNLLVFDRQAQSNIGGNKEEVIRDLTRLCVQELFDNVFNLSVKPSDKGPIATLPKPTTPIPREKPLPIIKPSTRWEKFANEKGIKSKKKSRLVFDEATDTYKPRYGRGRKDDPKDVWILPDNPEELKKYGAEDPFLLQKMKKKERVEKNKKLQAKNLKRAASAESQALPPTLDITKNAPKRQKHSLETAVSLAQLSTASMGRFDNKLAGEPQIRRASHALPNKLPKELKATSKIADRVLKKSTGLNLEKAVRNEIKLNPKNEMRKSKDKKKSKSKSKPKKKSNKKGGKRQSQQNKKKKGIAGVIITK